MEVQRFHTPDAVFWRGRRVFLTGHTGFKGSWLAFWLLELGAELTGLALPPEPGPSMFEALGLDAVAIDIRGLLELLGWREPIQPYAYG